jgi:hypothetical protein
MRHKLAILCVLQFAITSAFAQTAQFSHPVTVQSFPYIVDGLALGGQIKFESQSYKQYQCRPSDQFTGFTWCQRARTERNRHGEASSHSILHNQDGRIAYVNRYIEPALFGRNDIRNEIDRLSAKFGERPREFRIPQHNGLPRAVIAVWGKIQLQQLNRDDVSIIASGGRLQKGILVGSLGDIQRSAKRGTPVYRLAGGPGFLWSASFDKDGTGILRFLAVDPSQISPPPQIAPSAGRSNPALSTAAPSTPSLLIAAPSIPATPVAAPSTAPSQAEQSVRAEVEAWNRVAQESAVKAADVEGARRAAEEEVRREATEAEAAKRAAQDYATKAANAENAQRAAEEETRRQTAEAEAVKRSAQELVKKAVEAEHARQTADLISMAALVIIITLLGTIAVILLRGRPKSVAKVPLLLPVRKNEQQEPVIEATKRDHEVCAPKPRGGSRSALEDYADRILALIAEQPDRTLDELAEAMRKRGIPGSRSALRRFLDRHDITFKKKPAGSRTTPRRRGASASALDSTPGLP